MMATTIERMREARACADCALPDDGRDYYRRAADNLDCDGCARIVALAVVPTRADIERSTYYGASDVDAFDRLRADIEGKGTP